MDCDPSCWTYSNSLNNEAANQNDETSNLNNLKSLNANLTDIIKNLTTANLVTSLAIKEYPATIQYNISYENALFIVGSVTNTGEGVAYNAGLHIVAYTVDNALEIDMIVPLSDVGAGYDSSTYSGSHPQLSTLFSGYNTNSASIGVAIHSQNLVSNWTVTPVWTNAP